MARKKKAGKKRVRRRRPAVVPGTAPGKFADNPNAAPATIRVFGYGPGGLEEVKQATLDDLERLRGKWPNLWVDVDNVADTNTLRDLGARFGLHPLALEDTANVGQRPKVDRYDDHLYVVLTLPADGEQVSIYLGEGLVLTFQERPGDCFEPIRARIRHGQGRIRKSGPDYLVYALIDSAVDSHFPILERISSRLEQIEERIIAGGGEGTPTILQGIRAELRELGHANLPYRDLVQALLHPETPFFQEETRPFLHDCLDHAIRVGQLLDVCREESTDLMHLHMASVSNKMNEIMKVLTVMAAIFIPLTFIAGIYGMNFSAEGPWNMPELRWRYGYPAVLALMAAIAGGLLLFFKRRDWF